PQLDLLDEVGRAEERLLRAGVEPGEAAAERLHLELRRFEVAAIEIGDLQLAARGRLEPRREVADPRVVEVQARHREVRARLLRLLFDADGAAALVELDDAVALRIVHAIGEDRRSAGPRAGAAQRVGQSVSVEDVVAEDQAARRAGDELASDDERLRQSAWIRLRRVLEVDAPPRSVAQQPAKQRLVLGRADD